MRMLMWSDDLNTGIHEIDIQHRKIVAYINQFQDSYAVGKPTDAIEKTFDRLVDCTLSHFAFEESLQEQAQYPFSKAHKRVHDHLARRLREFQSRYKSGEDVFDELNKLLVNWLFNHIRCDDADYIKAVRTNADVDNLVDKRKSILDRIFGQIRWGGLAR